MFTFSFSTAFAAVPNFNKEVATANFELAMTAAKTAGKITLNGESSTTYVIKYTTLDAHKAEILEAVLDYEKNGNASGYAQTAADVANIIDLKDNTGAFVYDVAMTLVAAQYEADKAGALAILGGLDTSAFSTKEMPASMVALDEHECETYVEHVQAEIADAVADINTATFTTDSTLKTYADAKAVIDQYFETYDGSLVGAKAIALEKGYLGANNAKVGLGIYGVKGFDSYKATAVDASEATSAANVAAVKAEIAKQYALYMAEPTTDTAEEKAFAANTKKITEFLADEKVSLGTISTFFNYNAYAADAAAAVANAATFEALAARLAAQTDVNGALVRDAEDVADLVAEGITYEYCDAFNLSTTGLKSIGTCLAEIEDLYLGLDEEELAFVKAVRETWVKSLISGFETNAIYYPLELAKVKALTDEYLAKVNAVTEIAKVDDYDATYFGTGYYPTKTSLGGKVGAVLEASEVDALSSNLDSVAKQYLDLMNSQIKKAADKYDTSNTYAKLYKEIDKLVGNSEARTTKEIAALSADAVALINTLPTVAQVEAAGEAVEDAVDALPTTVTTAHKEVIDAAIAANKAYKALTTVNHSEYTTYIVPAVTKYAFAFNNEIVAKVKAVDKADKAALKALKSEINAFTKTYGNAAVLATELGKVQTALDNIQKAEAKAVDAAIVAIPVTANLTEAATAKIEAARVLYDAYVAEYTDTYDYAYNYAANHSAETDGFVADDFAYATIVNAETLLGLNVDKDAEIIASVEGLKIKANSSAKKGSITVKWTVTGNTEHVEKYQVYKSTKAQKGYKKAITTTKTSFKNTKNLKKGTRYYYKVRAYVTVDGVKYYSDWSNKANRIAK